MSTVALDLMLVTKYEADFMHGPDVAVKHGTIKR